MAVKFLPQDPHSTRVPGSELGRGAAVRTRAGNEPGTRRAVEVPSEHAPVREGSTPECRSAPCQSALCRSALCRSGNASGTRRAGVASGNAPGMLRGAGTLLVCRALKIELSFVWWGLFQRLSYRTTGSRLLPCALYWISEQLFRNSFFQLF